MQTRSSYTWLTYSSYRITYNPAQQSIKSEPKHSIIHASMLPRRTAQSRSQRRPHPKPLTWRHSGPDGSQRHLRNRPGKDRGPARARRHSRSRSQRNNRKSRERRDPVQVWRPGSSTSSRTVLSVRRLFLGRLYSLQRIQEDQHRPVRLRRILPGPRIQCSERSCDPAAPRTLLRGRSHDGTHRVLYPSNTESPRPRGRQCPHRWARTNRPHTDPTTPPCHNRENNRHRYHRGEAQTRQEA